MATIYCVNFKTLKFLHFRKKHLIQQFSIQIVQICLLNKTYGNEWWRLPNDDLLIKFPSIYHYSVITTMIILLDNNKERKGKNKLFANKINSNKVNQLPSYVHFP